MFSLKPQYSKFSDEYLVQLLVNGDVSAFNQLYTRYNQRLLYYFYRMLGNSNEKAQDFLQDIFLKLMNKSASFDPSRKFTTWIFSIAHNMCKNEYRRMDTRKVLVLESISDGAWEEADPVFDESDIDPEEFSRQLFEELQSFDEIHKTAFLLRYREELSLKEIGQILDISEGTVKSRLFYTRKRLSERLERYRKASY